MISKTRNRLPSFCSGAHERQQHLRAQLLDSLKAALPPPGTSLEARAGGDLALAGLAAGDALSGDEGAADDLGGGEDLGDLGLRYRVQG